MASSWTPSAFVSMTSTAEWRKAKVSCSTLSTASVTSFRSAAESRARPTSFSAVMIRERS